MQDVSTVCRTRAYSEWLWPEHRRLKYGPCMPCERTTNPKVLNGDEDNSIWVSTRSAISRTGHNWQLLYLVAYRPNTSLVQEMATAVSPAEDGGYDELAALMVRDKGLSTFRSYMKLNTQNLLILQAEITLTEKELRKIMHEDQGSGEFHREKYRACVSYMKEGIESSAQWAKWLELRELLEKYSE